MRIVESFRDALARFEIESLDAPAETIYALDSEGRLAFLNRGWDDFARANGAAWAPGAWDLGCRAIDAVPEVLRPFYEDLFARAASVGEPLDHEYECSSPETERRFVMRVFPLPRRSGFLVTNTLRLELPRASGRARAIPDELRRADGSIVMCAHCRRTQRADGSAWVWVDAWVERPPTAASHGLCSVCFEHHYPRSR